MFTLLYNSHDFDKPVPDLTFNHDGKIQANSFWCKIRFKPLTKSDFADITKIDVQPVWNIILKKCDQSKQC